MKIKLYVNRKFWEERNFCLEIRRGEVIYEKAITKNFDPDPHKNIMKQVIFEMDSFGNLHLMDPEVYVGEDNKLYLKDVCSMPELSERHAQSRVVSTAGGE